MMMSIRPLVAGGMFILASVFVVWSATAVNDRAECNLADKLIERIVGSNDGTMPMLKQEDAIAIVHQSFANTTGGFNQDRVEQMSRMVRSGLAAVYCKDASAGTKCYLFLRLFREPCIYDCYRYDEVTVDGAGNLLSVDLDAVIYL